MSLIAPRYLFNPPPSTQIRAIPYRYPLIGRGHLIDHEASTLHAGTSIRTYDVNLDKKGGVLQRGAMMWIAENGACGELLSSFDFQQGENWVNGQGRREKSETGTSTGAGASTITLPVIADMIFTDQIIGRTIRILTGPGAGDARVISDWDSATRIATVTVAWSTPPTASDFVIDPIVRSYGYAALQTEAARLGSTSGTPTPQAALNYASPQDFDTDENEFLCYWLWVYDKNSINWTASQGVHLTFYTVNFSDGFRDVVPQADIKDVINDGTDGWNFRATRRSAFVAFGAAPDWQSIVSRQIKYWRLGGAANESVVVFCNSWLGPERFDGLYNFRRSLAKGGGNWILAAARGKLDVLIPEEQRWRRLASDLTPGKPVVFYNLNDYAYVLHGGRPKVVLSNTEIYAAGIVPPDATTTVTINLGAGAMNSGAHRAAIVFYSTITGRESNPTFTDQFTVAANDQVTYNNIPVSADPKVTHVRIYRRAPGFAAYQRTSAAIDGEITNGVTTFTEGLAGPALGNPLEGASTYDLNGVPPNAEVGAVVGNHVILNDLDQPGRVWVSRESNSEQFPAAGNVPLDEGDNDVIRAVTKYGAFALVWKLDSFYVGYNVGGLQPFDFIKRGEKIGNVSQRGTLVSRGRVWWRHTTGFYVMSSDWEETKIGSGWDLPSDLGQAEPSLEDLDDSELERITAAFITRRDQLLWSEQFKAPRSSAIQPVLHERLAFNSEGEEVSGWVFHRAPIHIMAPAREQTTHKEYVVAGGDAGLIYRLDQKRLDDALLTGDAAIDADYITPPLDQSEAARGFGPEILKQYPWIQMLMRPGGNWPVDFEARLTDWEGQVTTVTGQFVPVGVGAGIGSGFTIGVSAIGGSGGAFTRGEGALGRFRSVSLRFRNGRLNEGMNLGGFYLGTQIVRGAEINI